MSEFDLIARHLAPLAGEGALGLEDDAAEAFNRVLTKDVLVEGIHFLSSDPLDLVARKALRVNLSDLIAKGATPEAYLLGVTWPGAANDDDVRRFAEGLAEEQRVSGLNLLGGDTTRGEHLTISVTMIGRPGLRGMIRRSGGSPGDKLFVTGTIGEGLLGLEAAQAGEDPKALAYRVPQVPLGFEAVIAERATACLDVSDGLVADAGHLAQRSGIRLRINADMVPLSVDGVAAKKAGRLLELLTGGDDYQCLFLARDVSAEMLSTPSVKVAEIGYAEAGEGVVLVGADGEEMSPPRAGWDHFS